MAVLANVRHERFCQELAKGKTNAEAYELAGYQSVGATASAAATRLLKDVKIQGRLADIQKRGAERAEITVASVTEHLSRIALKAEALGEAPGLNVAKGAWETAAKLHGLMIERKEVRTGSLDELPADTISRVREQLIVARTRHIDSGSGSEAPRKPH
jgi:phage terminase small subunit